MFNDMHNCLNQAIDYFNVSYGSSTSDSIVSNPAKLCLIVKQSVREMAVAAAKLLLFCDLFTRRKSELTREERLEIITYAKSRTPIFMNQVVRFLHALKVTFSSMSTGQRQEVATYLVPEVNHYLMLKIFHSELIFLLLMPSNWIPLIVVDRNNFGYFIHAYIRSGESITNDNPSFIAQRNLESQNYGERDVW